MAIDSYSYAALNLITGYYPIIQLNNETGGTRPTNEEIRSFFSNMPLSVDSVEQYMILHGYNVQYSSLDCINARPDGRTANFYAARNFTLESRESGDPYVIIRLGSSVQSGLFYGGGKYHYIVTWTTTNGESNQILKIEVNNYPTILSGESISINVISTTSSQAGFLGDNIIYDYIPNPDPYTPGGESGPGGGTGDFDGTGDDIDIPGLPTLSAVDTGFITLFNPTISQLRDLATYMWTNPLFDLANWRKLFADPMDAILGLSIVPVAVPDGGVSAVTVGNISTGVSMTKAARQYVEVDCGTLNVNEFWGAYLDYDPYTKAEIYLPYIGAHPIAVDDIMGKPVRVVYHVDILSGACCAYVKCGGSVLYSFVGQCTCSVPICGRDWTNVINGVLSIGASIGTMVATYSAYATNNMTAAAFAGSTVNRAADAASNAINIVKPSVEKSGALSGMGGMLDVQVPYLILTRPRQALPASQNTYTGYPSYITRKLGDLSGYTEIDSIHLEGVSATDAEMTEIVTLLHRGVIL